MSNNNTELIDEELQNMASGNDPKMIIGTIHFQLPGGNTTSDPPIGPGLGQYGIDISKFVDEFNERTREYEGSIVPTTVYIYADHSFSFTTKTPVAATKYNHELEPGSGVNEDKIARLDRKDFERLR